ncbi:MAG: hypothetical protein EOP09_04585 [Proteobacteria bacterium]|nr:MAG: hypothetical protein EOP09_04585 [Pseudomonadota bacterium]
MTVISHDAASSWGDSFPHPALMTILELSTASVCCTLRSARHMSELTKRMAMELSVMTFNIHKGKHAILTSRTLSRIRDFLASHSVDIVFLQEVIGSDPGEADYDQVKYLADGLSSQFCYGKNLIVDSYHHGNAILSRYPIVDWKNEDLSTNKYEKRGVLEATIQLPNQVLAKAFCCHLNLLRGSRRTQINRIAKIIDDQVAGFNGPFFVGGDFNDWQQDASRIFEEPTWREVGRESDDSHFLTFPSWFPSIALDRIYYRSAELINAETTTFGKLGFLSDHLPVLAKFKIP